jgi:hypothetical protein
MKSILKFIGVLSITIGLFGCGNEEVKPDSSENTAWLMKLAIDNNDFDSFNDLFTDERKESISKNDFTAFRDITTAGSEYKNYELLTFANGQMLLVKLAPPNKDKKVKIEDVFVVPENMKELFNN